MTRGYVGVAAAVLAVTASAHADAGAELRARLAELEAKSGRDDTRIAQLETRLAAIEKQSGRDWLTHERADEIRSLVEDVLADADTRTSLLAGPDTGYDDGAIIASRDGNWLLRTNMHMQQRFVFNNQSNSPSGDNTRWGFENARTKFIMTGHVVSPEWFYKVEIEVARLNTGLPTGESRTGLLDAYAGYDFGNGWKIGAGTFKAPLLREELVDSRFQMAVERSVTNYLYTGGRTDGIAVDYLGEQFHFTGSFNNGIDDGLYGGALNTGGGSAILSPTADFAFTARGEFLIEGEWDRFYDFTSPQGEDTAMMVGAAMHFQTPDADAAGVPDIDLLVLTADFTGQFNGWSTFGEVIFTNASPSAGSSVNTFSLIAQGSYYFTQEWEGFGRYEWSNLDTLSPNDVNIVTLGATRYFAGQNAKWTTDVGIGLDSIDYGAGVATGTAAAPVTGWRQDNPNSDGQVLIRSQLQILF